MKKKNCYSLDKVHYLFHFVSSEQLDMQDISLCVIATRVMAGPKTYLHSLRRWEECHVPDILRWHDG